jgi:tight adherence protein C
LAILYEEQYAEYYLRVVQAQRVTITSIVVAVGFIFYGVCASFTVFGVIMMMAFLAYYYYGDEIHQRIRKRSQAIMTDFSEIVSELALLSNAGMVLREAWDIVAQKGNGTIHQEMRRVVNDINNGKPEAEAYYDFGVRCILPEIKKFTSTILQGMTKGNQELGAMLQEQSGDIWKQKKQSIEQVAQEATTKLMIPMCIMFLGIIILVVVPIFANIGMS